MTQSRNTMKHKLMPADWENHWCADRKCSPAALWKREAYTLFRHYAAILTGRVSDPTRPRCRRCFTMGFINHAGTRTVRFGCDGCAEMETLIDKARELYAREPGRDHDHDAFIDAGRLDTFLECVGMMVLKEGWPLDRDELRCAVLALIEDIGFGDAAARDMRNHAFVAMLKADDALAQLDGRRFRTLLTPEEARRIVEGDARARRRLDAMKGKVTK